MENQKEKESQEKRMEDIKINLFFLNVVSIEVIRQNKNEPSWQRNKQNNQINMLSRLNHYLENYFCYFVAICKSLLRGMNSQNKFGPNTNKVWTIFFLLWCDVWYGKINFKMIIFYIPISFWIWRKLLKYFQWYMILWKMLIIFFYTSDWLK